MNPRCAYALRSRPKYGTRRRQTCAALLVPRTMSGNHRARTCPCRALSICLCVYTRARMYTYVSHTYVCVMLAYIHIYAYAYMHACTHTYMRKACMHACNTYIRAHIHTHAVYKSAHILILRNIDRCKCIRTFVHRCTYAYMHVAHTKIHAYIIACRHTHMHTHTLCSVAGASGGL